ncbi:MAG: hypothetical protein QM803_06705 [Rhodocyclaceae bacterium]
MLRTGSIFSTKGYPKNLTYLVRVAPVTGVTYGSQQRFLDVELSLSEANATEGARIVFSVRNDSVAKGVYLDLVEQSSTTSVSGTPLDMSVPHIYQISTVLNGPRSGSFTVYADGSDTPVVPTITSNDLRWAWLPANFIQIGDNGASAATSDIDWMVWSDRGAFKPSELKGRLPAGIGITTGY